MNSRIYDPTLGRFLQADPHVQAPSNSQNYNRYSYVLNNPKSYTDPSGYFFGKILKAIGSNRFLSTIISIGLNFISGCQDWCAAAATSAFNAAVTYAITGSLKGAMIGAFAGAISPAGYGPSAFLARGLIGGLASSAQGGKFGHGFIAAGAGGAANGISNVGLRILASAVIGGTVSRITGGKFGNGATSSAFAALVTAGFRGEFKTVKNSTGSLSHLKDKLESLTDEQREENFERGKELFEKALEAIRDSGVDTFDDVTYISIVDSKGGDSFAQTTCYGPFGCSSTLQVSREYLEAGFSAEDYLETAYHETLHFSNRWVNTPAAKTLGYYEPRHFEIIDISTRLYNRPQENQLLQNIYDSYQGRIGN